MDKLEKIKNSRLELKHLLIIWFTTIPVISSTIIILAICFGYWHLVLAYFIYVYFESRSGLGAKAPNKHRNSFLFDVTKEYFDLKIVKTADIPPTKNYIFCYHPHGATPFGMYSGLNSNCCGFDDLYPGINLNLKGHAFFLSFPLLREFCLYFGGQHASKESIVETLSKPGQSVGINIGGGAEMIYAVPKTAKLVVKNRFGFIKIALETGSDLVPVYAFGEVDTYNQKPVDEKCRYFWIRRKFYKTTNFFVPYITGRGMLPNTKGMFPLSVPIRIVIGKPISVEKTPNPSVDQIKDLHDKYCNELEALYNKYKDEFWYDSDNSAPKLEFAENPLK